LHEVASIAVSARQDGTPRHVGAIVMLISLLGYFSLMITTLTAVVALLIGFSNNNSSFEKGHLPRPIIVQTVTADEATPWRSPASKEQAKNVSVVASAPKADAKESMQHKPKPLARQRNNNQDYWNLFAYRNDPRGLFIH
jgi:hypothetical protein